MHGLRERMQEMGQTLRSLRKQEEQRQVEVLPKATAAAKSVRSLWCDICPASGNTDDLQRNL